MKLATAAAAAAPVRLVIRDNRMNDGNVRC